MTPSVLHLVCQAWSVPKAGSAPEENEDAFRIGRSDDGGAGVLLCVADGATEAIYSRRWARTLVAAAEPRWPELDDGALRAELDRVRAGFSPLGESMEHPWYVRDKFLAQGSQSTLLVVGVEPGADGRSTVRAVAVGDGCALLLKADGTWRGFPIEASGAFGSSPDLVRSLPQPDLAFARWRAEMELGDVLLAATDAVAGWALECVERGRVELLWELLLALFDAPADACASQPLVALRQACGSRPRMRNDDATLIGCIPTPADERIEARRTLVKHLEGSRKSLDRREE
ncbi:MAG: protein phosphatase 2C domain-containing protein [bacterium]|nr:protein phosphatase 2C domain-containing protein [bacterium]